MRTLILGTRGSSLARRQTQLVMQALREHQPELQIEELIVQTEGDRRIDVSLDAIGGQGAFVKDIEQRLLKKEIDVAVHSLKDMPSEESEALTIGAVLPRADVRDALIARDGLSFAALPAGARIGSDSPRRATQLRAMRPDIEMVSIRGNVETRIRKVESGEYDAVVLAAAGLERLGLIERATQVFTLQELLPAVGQGAIAVQCRSGDAEVIDILAEVDDPDTRSAITSERAFLRELGAGCSLPVGAYGTVNGATVHLEALLADSQGKPHRAGAEAPTSAADRLGTDLAQRLRLEAGA